MPEECPSYNGSKREQLPENAPWNDGETLYRNFAASPPKAGVTGSNPVGCAIKSTT
jgi:hypothetical protein